MPKSKRPLEPDLDDRTLFDRASLEIEWLLLHHRYLEAIVLDQKLDAWLENLDIAFEGSEPQDADADFVDAA